MRLRALRRLVLLHFTPLLRVPWNGQLRFGSIGLVNEDHTSVMAFDAIQAAGWKPLQYEFDRDRHPRR